MDFDLLEDLNFGSPETFSLSKAPSDDNRFSKDLIFQYAPVSNPESFFPSLAKNESTKPLYDIKKGTTTLAFIYQGGIIIAVDSRASMGTFIASKTVRKVTEINDYLLGTIAGAACDCQFWERYLGMWCKTYELKNHKRVPVTAASECLSSWVGQYRGRGLSMGTMICGYDGDNQKIYMVNDDGSKIEGKYFSVGSGSTYALGLVDSKWRYDMTFEEAVELGRQAIHQATHRDIGSGGLCRIYHMTKDGWKIIIDAEDVNKIHYETENKKGLRGDGLEAGQDPFGY